VDTREHKPDIVTVSELGIGFQVILKKEKSHTPPLKIVYVY